MRWDIPHFWRCCCRCCYSKWQFFMRHSFRIEILRSIRNAKFSDSLRHSSLFKLLKMTMFHETLLQTPSLMEDTKTKVMTFAETSHIFGIMVVARRRNNSCDILVTVTLFVVIDIIFVDSLENSRWCWPGWQIADYSLLLDERFEINGNAGKYRR